MKHELSRNNNYDFFEEAMHAFFPAFYGYSDKRAQKYMRTDIKETKDSYILDVEMPGFEKDEISLDIENGYLTVRAAKSEKEEPDKSHRYVRKERSVSCQRSYYIGDISEDSVKAKYDKGVLTVTLPKKEEERPEPKKVIPID